MPASLKRKLQLRAVRPKCIEAIRIRNSQRPIRQGVAPDSPLKAVAEAGTKRKSSTPHPYIPEPLPPPKRPARPANIINPVVEVPASSSEVIEERWRAVVEFTKEQTAGHMTKPLAAEIAVRHGLGTGRNLRHIVKKANAGESLTRKPGSGRPRQRNYAAVNHFMKRVAARHDYVVTYSYLIKRVKEKFGYGSMWLVRRIMNDYKWTTVKQRVVPLLSDEHKKARHAWCEARPSPKELYGKHSKIAHIHTDEKVFYAFKKGKTLHVPPDVKPPVQALKSKTKIEGLMFLAAVGYPRPEYEFDGTILMLPITKEKVAKRNSKFHDAGDVYEITDTLNKARYQELLKVDLINAIIEKVGAWADRVIVQMDSAGGHGIKETLAMLNEYGKEIIVPPKGRRRERKITIEFVAQPTRSPDLNVLDLGAWNSLQSAVEECHYERNPTQKIVHRLRDAVLEAWEEWESAEKLTKLFQTLENVVKVVLHNGDNNFDIRHPER